jgi:hypothetical protein
MDLDILFLDQGTDEMGTLVVPNTVAAIADARIPNRRCVYGIPAFLRGRAVSGDDGWIHIPVHSDVTPSATISAGQIKVMQVDFSKMYEKLKLSQDDDDRDLYTMRKWYLL